MTQIHPQCQNLASQVNQIIQLIQQESSLRAHQDLSAVETSLRN